MSIFKPKPKPKPKSKCPTCNPKPIQAMGSPTKTIGKPTAICPRCGKTFDLEKPIEFCPRCNLELGEENEDGEMEWNERMAEPLPDFLKRPLANDQIFAKTLEWAWEEWVKPNLENPSHKFGKIGKDKIK